MFSKDKIEPVYSFLHQKLRVYEFSSIPSQKDDIEEIIYGFTNQMNPSLYSYLAGGKEDFLKLHYRFQEDMQEAVSRLEELMSNKN